MTKEELKTKITEKAQEFGLFTEEIKHQQGGNKHINAIIRSNLNDNNNANYFAFIRPEESNTGVYNDLSFVIFPQDDNLCVVSIAVGSQGYQRDYELVSSPGLRRLYTKLTYPDLKSFIKNDFTNIEDPIPELLNTIKEDDGLQGLHNSISKYKKFILAACIVDPTQENDLNIIFAWLAQYAQIRGWGTKDQIREQSEAIQYISEQIDPKNIDEEIKTIIKYNRFIVLQGAPGTGKTYNALKMAKDYKETYFIQFHAETTYSDFIGGIKPDLSANNLIYKHNDGKLVEAIKAAQKLQPESNERVLLIIDEINRANLSNVLGSVFFLFENHIGERKIKLKVGDLEISKLPDNLDVIATMNTADRSLAVIDFALRRRFTWYTIRPQKINDVGPGKVFHEQLFLKFCNIFDRYASDEELNLQPGPSYFITNQESANDIMKHRLIYELMPLIKEYLIEGIMSKAADSFSQLFYTEANVYLFE